LARGAFKEDASLEFGRTKWSYPVCRLPGGSYV